MYVKALVEVVQSFDKVYAADKALREMLGFSEEAFSLTWRIVVRFDCTMMVFGRTKALLSWLFSSPRALG